MQILVLGGTGFIGPHVVRDLAAAGHTVTVFNRGRSAREPLPDGVQHLTGDRRQLHEHAAALRALTPEVVLHMVPIGEADAREVVELFRRVARRIVGVSSMDVYRAYGRLLGLESGEPDPGPLAEDAPLRERLYPYREHASGPDDYRYRYEKILAERELLGCPEMPGTILRLPAVLGPHDPQHRLHDVLRRMDDGRPCILLGETQAAWRWDRGHVSDVAHGIALAVTDDRAAGRVYNVGEPDAPTEAEWVAEVGAAAGWDGDVVTLPDECLPAHLQSGADLRHHLAGDTTRIREELGYREAGPRAAWLADTIAWERANPPPEIDPARFDYEAEDAALAAGS
jgi:nucleoside-diphosphate-sugar epimerase